jgi:hypothetical protein
VLTGAAFGIVFLYLLDAGQEALAGQRRRPTGPVILGDDGGLGPFRTSVGRIPIAPLGEVEVGQPGRSAPNPETGGSNQPRQTGGSGDGLAPAPRRPIGLTQNPSPGYGGSGGFEGLPIHQPSGSGRGIAAKQIGPTDPGTVRDTASVDALEPVGLPQLLLVLVRVTSQSNAISVEGKAISQSLIDQHAVADSVVDMRYQDVPGFEMRSELNLPGFANSRLSDADLQVISQNVGIVNSKVLGGTAGELLVIGVQDLLSLVVMTPKAGSASINSRTTGSEQSRFDMGDGANVLDVEALQRLSFTAIGLPEQAKLSFNLLTEGLKSSFVKMGVGSDSLLINSGWYGGNLPEDTPVSYTHLTLPTKLL